MKFGWSDAEDIGISLCAKFPEMDPAHVRYTDMHKWIIELEDFEDDPAKSNEAKLEAIQMAWLDEWNESKPPR